MKKSDFILENKTVELNQNRKSKQPVDQMLCEKFVFDQKYSSTFKYATVHKCSTELSENSPGKASVLVFFSAQHTSF